MNQLTYILLASVIGFTHAFEADHLVAISSMVTKRNKLILAIKDGIFWGLGHTSMIMIVGIIIVVANFVIDKIYFRYFEMCVGIMLLVIGLFRFHKLFVRKSLDDQSSLIDDQKNHHLAYGIGLLHGLAGSGVLVLVVMTEMQNPLLVLAYLLIFGLGSIVGMLVASGIFSLPFSSFSKHNKKLQMGLVILSSSLCVFFGLKMIYENLS